MVYLLGDFSTQIDRKRDRWYLRLGEFGKGEANSKVCTLLQFFWYNHQVIKIKYLLIRWPIR